MKKILLVASVGALLLAFGSSQFWEVIASNLGNVYLVQAILAIRDDKYDREARIAEIYLPNYSDVGTLAPIARKATFWLQLVRQSQQQDPAIAAKLAQSLVLEGNIQGAIHALETTAAEPDGAGVRSLKMQAAVLHFAAGELGKGYQIWQELDLQVADAIRLANSYFYSRRFRNAATLYNAFLPLVRENSFAQMTRAVIANVASNISTLPSWASTQAELTSYFFPVNSSNKLLISGSQLRWLDEFPESDVFTGSLLYSGEDPTDGVMLWQGTAFGLIHIAETGTYCLTTIFRNVPPSGTEMEVGLDTKTIGSIVLSNTKGSLESLTVPIEINAGYHIVTATFLNDIEVDGLDRNAFIHGIQISSLVPGAAC